MSALVLIALNCILQQHQTVEENKKLDNCYLAIHNFVTLRQNFTGQNCLVTKPQNEFELKTYLMTYSSPYIIERLNHFSDDCLCCEK